MPYPLKPSAEFDDVVTIPSTKSNVTVTKFKVDDHVRVRRFDAGLHELTFDPEREPYIGLVAVVTGIYNSSVLILQFADGINWLWPVEACDFQWSLTMQHQFVAGDVVRALPHEQHQVDILELVRPYFGRQAVVLTAGERFAELEFEDGQRRGWPVSACEFKYRPWANVTDPDCTYNHGGPCPNCPRFNVISETQIAAEHLDYVCACGAALLWDPHGGRWLLQTNKNQLLTTIPNLGIPAEQLAIEAHSYGYAQASWFTLHAQMQKAIESMQLVLLPMSESVTSAIEVFQKLATARLEKPYDSWHAHVLEGGLAPCPCCEQPIPASLVPAVVDRKARCPLCNHTGTQPVCPVCRGLLISSHAFFNVRERWHCQDCGRTFDGDKHEI